MTRTNESSGLGVINRERIECRTVSPNKYMVFHQPTKAVSLRTFHYCHRRRPLVQNIQAHAPVGINVGVVNLRCESNFRWFERVISREGDIQEENATSVWRIILQTSKGVERAGKAGLDPDAMRQVAEFKREKHTGPIMVADQTNRLVSLAGPAL